MPYGGALIAAGPCGIGFGLLAVPIEALLLAVDYVRRALRLLRVRGRVGRSWRWVPTPPLAVLCIACAWTDWPLRYRFAGVHAAFEREALRLLATPAPPTSRPADYDPVLDSMACYPINESYDGRFGTLHVHGVGVFREQRVVYFFTGFWMWAGWGFVYHPDDERAPWSAIALADDWSSFAHVPMK